MGEGALFIEADADVRMQQFDDTLQSLFPCLEEFLLDVPGSVGVVNCPLCLFRLSFSLGPQMDSGLGKRKQIIRLAGWFPAKTL
ncbi:UNVERIFIED_CONTAM: Benzyl alcohol O-benzoyltransferase [Sesamum radiatum]|uniref:Benzyl alcohol O-benzoyltransferase n=1 Tax=Sesamum radiatum TaxID=300843 RepID=A0AAW2V202_SESRA